jgi:hypothetical protein
MVESYLFLAMRQIVRINQKKDTTSKFASRWKKQKKKALEFPHRALL